MLRVFNDLYTKFSVVTFSSVSRHSGVSTGILHMLAATFWFALMNVSVKKISHLPAMEMVFFRCGIASILCIAGLMRVRVSLKGNNNRILLLRGLFGTIGLYTFFLTVQQMPLGTAVTIQYLSPIFSAIFAYFILKEKILPVQWLFFIISFAGVILIKGFDSDVSWTMLFTGLISAIFAALAYNMVRSLSNKEHPLVVVLHFQFLGFITGAIFTSFNWKQPAAEDWAFILLTGIFTQLGQVNLTRSLQKENIGKVSILNYLGIFYAVFFGWFLFGEKTGPGVIAGMLLVSAGVISNLLVTGLKKSPVPEPSALETEAPVTDTGSGKEGL